MVTAAAVWAILLLPLGSFAVIALVIRPFLNRWPLSAGLLTIGAMAAALALSIWTLDSRIANGQPEFAAWRWLDVGAMAGGVQSIVLGHDQIVDAPSGAVIELGLLIDPLTAVMLVVVTAVSLLVQVYSLGYMRGDPGFCRYYAYMSLFTAAMLGLVLSSNIVQLYIFWELVGVSSYLLIGFWHERPSAAAAAKKAFIITRIGDVGFLIAILYLFLQADAFAAAGLNAFHIPDIWQAAQPLAAGGALLGGAALTWLSLGIFAGAAGKSGQFPLHTWLPDAMEGPTPVSALIHAATMVAAGVFLVARFYPVFQHSAEAMTVVALVGAFTALFAATMGLAANDIKRVMAYSTISQLGYMMAALGVGAYGPALFHLVTHAAFKALLFLGAGSVNHASGTFDMRYMGGLRKHLPWTYALVLLAGLSLVGLIPLTGFWSKDEILLGAWQGSGLVESWVSRVTFAALLAGVIVTAFYTLRMILLTFHGEFRGGAAAEQAAQNGHPAAGDTANAIHNPTGHTAAATAPNPIGDAAAHATGHAAAANDDAAAGAHNGVHLGESPWVMVAPMLVLGGGAAVMGYLINPVWGKGVLPLHWITGFLGDGLLAAMGLEGHAETLSFSPLIALISTAAALAGMGAAWLLYRTRRRAQPAASPEGATPEAAPAAETPQPAPDLEPPAPEPLHPAPVAEPLRAAGPLYTLLARKYYMDELYENLAVRRGFHRLLAGTADWLDRHLVDGLVGLIGWFFRNIGSAIGRLQTGQVQAYASIAALGIILIVVVFLLV